MDLYRTARETALLGALRVAIALFAMIGRELAMSEAERRSHSRPHRARPARCGERGRRIIDLGQCGRRRRGALSRSH